MDESACFLHPYEQIFEETPVEPHVEHTPLHRSPPPQSHEPVANSARPATDPAVAGRRSLPNPPCQQCRMRKLKCDAGDPCSFCKENDLDCSFRQSLAPRDDNFEKVEAMLVADEHARGFKPSPEFYLTIHDLTIEKKSEVRDIGWRRLLCIPHAEKSYHTTSLSYAARHQRTERIAPGALLDLPMEALVDTCASNLLSLAYISKLGVRLDRRKRTRIRRADGSMFSTLGRVVLPWRFDHELEVHKLTFDVVPDSYTGNYPLVLGGKFMHATKTLSHFAHRVISKVRDLRLPRIMFQGQSHLRMMGSCGGVRIAALPDTGSDVNLVSPTMADILQHSGAEVLFDPEHHITLELPGGIFTRTVGVVKNVDYRFGKGDLVDQYVTDFHILPDLPAQVLLSDSLLSEADAFEKYHEDMVEFDSIEELFLNIKLVYDNPSLLSKARSFFKKLKKQPPSEEEDNEVNHDLWCEQQIQILNEIESVIQDVTLSQAEKDTAIRRLEALHRNKLAKMRAARPSP